MVFCFWSIYKPRKRIPANIKPIINMYQSSKSNEMNVDVTHAI